MTEMREMILSLQETNSQLEMEKQEIEKSKSQLIDELRAQVKELEQKLIDSNLEIANV